jgi:uncharacterized Zn finger protein
MEPLGLAFKQEGGEVGELCVVNRCLQCGVVRKNRLSGDDNADAVLDLYHRSQTDQVEAGDIQLLDATHEREIITQLFGRPYAEKYFSKPR